MERIADLKTETTEPDVAQPAPCRVCMQQIRKDSLFRGAELPRPGQNAAAVDPYRKLKRRSIFDGHDFGGQFRSAVQRNRLPHREALADPCGADAVRKCGGLIEREGVVE